MTISGGTARHRHHRHALPVLRACSAGCASRARTVEPREFPTNRGGLCQKGWTAGGPPRLARPADRAARPGGRRAAAGHLGPALDLVANRIVELQARHGRDAVAVFGGGGLTNEKAYLLGKFARVALGTSRIDYNGRFCMSVGRGRRQPGVRYGPGLPFPVEDLRDADAVLLVGANPAETMPPFVQHLRGAELIVVDPRRSATAEQAALHLQAAPGTDLALALGILHAVVADGHLRHDYLADRTTGFDDVWRIAAAWWPERVERVTGVAAADQRPAAALLAGATNAYVLTARGHRAARPRRGHGQRVDQPRARTGTARPARLRVRLPDRAGQRAGRPRARAEGRPAARLPQARRPGGPRARRRRCGASTRTRCPGPGSSAYELLDSGPTRAAGVRQQRGRVRAARRPRRRRLSEVDLLVVADVVLSETAAMADVVLPVTQWAEEDGTLTNLEGRILLRRKAVAAAGRTCGPTSRCCTGSRSGSGSPRDRFPVDARGGVRRAAPCVGGWDRRLLRGVTYDRLRDGEALHWPVPSDRPPRHAARVPRPVRARGRAGAVRRRSTTVDPPSHRTTSSPCRPPRAACCSTTSPARRPGSCPS